MLLFSIKKSGYKYILWIGLLIWTFSGWNVTFAKDNIPPTTTAPKEEIKFWKIFQMFIEDPDVQNSKKEKDIATCNYLNANPLKKKSLEWFGALLYFVFHNIIIIGWLIAFMFYKIVDIYKDIRSEEIVNDNNWNVSVKKDITTVLMNSIIKQGWGIFSILIFFIVILIIINSLTLKCW